MHKLNIAVVGTCLTIGAFTLSAGPEATTLDVIAAPHGAVAVQTGKLYDAIQISSARTERPVRSTLTLPSDPKTVATARLNRYLTSNAQETGPGRIGWHINDALAAYKRAVAENKPLVLIFGKSDCGACKKMLADVLPCTGVNRFAGRAVFAYSEPATDSAARYIGAKLLVNRAPTITIIEPRGDKIEERARITGYFSAAIVSADLEKFLSTETSWNGSALPFVPVSTTGTRQAGSTACR
ncbi:MAG: thioredoxin fold domain-containing protein [Hyphomicrobiales bacterium]